GGVRGNGGGAVGPHGMGFVAGAVAAVVEGHEAATVAREEGNPARLDPVEAHRRGKAVDQQDRLALTHVPKGDAHTVGVEALHAGDPRGPRSTPIIPGRRELWS